jgi:hypothetical protein
MYQKGNSHLSSSGVCGESPVSRQRTRNQRREKTRKGGGTHVNPAAPRNGLATKRVA